MYTNPTTTNLIHETPQPDFLLLVSPPTDTEVICGEHFHMDFGFPRGKYIDKDELGQRVTSIDGYNCYLLIIDHCSRYTWVMLGKRKTLPINFFRHFFKHHGNPTSRRVVTTDKGGDLQNSLEFRQLILQSNYLLQPTAPDAPHQNGKAERPNQTFRNMMWCLLHGANLPSEFWSFALIHAVKLKIILPHESTKATHNSLLLVLYYLLGFKMV